MKPIRCYQLFICRWRSHFSLTPVNLDLQMRDLIKKERYRDALDLFNRQSAPLSDVSINLALKASTKLSDYESGERLYRHYFSKSLTNPFLQTSFIHFYSKSNGEKRLVVSFK